LVVIKGLKINAHLTLRREKVKKWFENRCCVVIISRMRKKYNKNAVCGGHTGRIAN
jgi:hypothetical protein